MCKQLTANPKVEIACYDGEGNTLRICGKAVFATSDETQAKALEVTQVSTWNWISGVCYAIMLCSGIVPAIPAIQAHTLNIISVIKGYVYHAESE
jgi:uncharacterized membrane protein YdcZ (DUF606 family)